MALPVKKNKHVVSQHELDHMEVSISANKLQYLRKNLLILKCATGFTFCTTLGLIYKCGSFADGSAFPLAGLVLLAAISCGALLNVAEMFETEIIKADVVWSRRGE